LILVDRPAAIFLVVVIVRRTTSATTTAVPKILRIIIPIREHEIKRLVTARHARLL
jgi:hypothetical protein